jgi:hypothetical protein
VKGEDPDKLQKEAFLAAGLPGNSEHKDGKSAAAHYLPIIRWSWI